MVTGKSHNPTRFARFVLYPIAGVIFCIMLTVVLILANGYRFIYTDGKVNLTKTGMLIVTTRPFDASISLNGKITKYKTNFHLLATKISSLKPGDYSVEVRKKGYRTWSNTLEIKPNMVTWANYILLFAEKLNIEEIGVPDGNVIAKSENGRHLLFATSTGKFDLKSIDTNNLSQKEFWPVTSSTLPWLVSPAIQSAQYSPSANMVLLKVSNGDRAEYVIVDASSSQVKLIHLNTTLKQDLTNVWWNISNNNEVYVQTVSGFSLININDTTVSAPILKEAVTFHVDESRQLLFVVKDSLGTYSVARMNLDGGNRTTLIPSIVGSKSYKLGYSTQKDVLTVLNQDTAELTNYYVGNSNKKTSMLLSGGVTSFGWSKNGGYLYYYGKDFVKRYDWEKGKEVVTSLSEAPTSLQWYFDENHYLVTIANGIYEMDFDGSNIIDFSASPISASALDTGNNNIIYATKDAAGLDKYFKFISEF